MNLLVQAEHTPEHEAKRAAVLVDAGACQVAFLHRVQQVALHVVGAQGVGAAGVVAHQADHRANVGFLRAALPLSTIASSMRCRRWEVIAFSSIEARAHARIDQGTAINRFCLAEFNTSRQRFSSSNE